MGARTEYKEYSEIDKHGAGVEEITVTRGSKSERGDKPIITPELGRSNSNRKEASDGLRNGIE
jgi:hypothetical protein